MSYQQAQPTDLDAFNQDTSALRLQVVGTSLASSPPPPRGSNPQSATPAPALAGTQPTFGYNPITPIPTPFPIQTPSFSSVNLAANSPRHWPFGNEFSSFYGFSTSPFTRSYRSYLTPAPPIPSKLAATGEELMSEVEEAQEVVGEWKEERRRRGRGRNTSASADSARSYPAAPARNSPATPSVVLPVTDPSLSGNDDGGAENSDDDRTKRPRKKKPKQEYEYKRKTGAYSGMLWACGWVSPRQ